MPLKLDGVEGGPVRGAAVVLAAALCATTVASCARRPTLEPSAGAVGSGLARTAVASGRPTVRSSGNPLWAEGEASRGAALGEGRLIYLRECRPCHGMLGGGDGPYGSTFTPRTPELRAGGDAARARADFERVQLGGAAHSPPGAPPQPAMPAFGDVLSDREIWSVLLAVEELAALATGGERAGADGAASYAARCAACHGTNGDGNGRLAPELYPRPRDFTRASYRVRSTPALALPSDADLLWTLKHGLGDTAMGSFAALGSTRLERLVQRVKEFAAPRFVSVTAPPAIPEPPPSSPALLARGRVLYDDAHCWQCHGRQGRGDGPTARLLKDESGDAALPANLTKRWQLKGGAGAAALFRSIAAGMRGTPMPSYAEALTPDELWAIARYVESLGMARAEPPSAVHATLVGDRSLPRHADAPLWSTLDFVAVPLGPQMLVAPRWRRPSVDVMQIAAVVSREDIGLVLEWDDRFADTLDEDAPDPGRRIDARRVGRWRLPDRVAVDLAARATSTEGVPPNARESVERAPVRWQWSAAQPPDPDGTVSVTTAGGGGGSVRHVGRVGVAARFAAGRWRVVFVGDRGGAAGLGFPSGAKTPLTLKAWDGSYGESGGRHARSSWLHLIVPGGPRVVNSGVAGSHARGN